MLRGTNRSIIEINETENKYFEKILIFVKPEFGTLPADRLTREAGRLVGGMSASPMGLNRSNSVRRRAALRKRRKLLTIGGILILSLVIAFIKLL